MTMTASVLSTRHVAYLDGGKRIEAGGSPS